MLYVGRPERFIVSWLWFMTPARGAPLRTKTLKVCREKKLIVVSGKWILIMGLLLVPPPPSIPQHCSSFMAPILFKIPPPPSLLSGLPPPSFSCAHNELMSWVSDRNPLEPEGNLRHSTEREDMQEISCSCLLFRCLFWCLFILRTFVICRPYSMVPVLC